MEKETQRFRQGFALLVTLVLTSCSNNLNITHLLICDTLRIKNDMNNIVNTTQFRNYKNINTLNHVADYIKTQFQFVSDSVSEQPFEFEGGQYKNIVCSINTEKKERIVVGAHYDVCGNQDGADDNASGIVGLLELARKLKDTKLNYRIDFVAYTLEEPPAYGTEFMGSNIHAKYLYENDIAVKGMICLEMIGYYSDQQNSQDYPFGLLSWFYGDVGDYIMIVQKYGNGDFGDKLEYLMKKNMVIKTKGFKSPSFIKGIDFSDHRNYWKYGYSAVMVTNTSFYRNGNYHLQTDTIGTIDFRRLALTVDELYLAIKELE